MPTRVVIHESAPVKAKPLVPSDGCAPRGEPLAEKLSGNVAPWQASGAEASMCMRIGIVVSPCAGASMSPENDDASR